MADSSASAAPFPLRAFLLTALLNVLWINLSEVCRYFVLVMPLMREARPEIENVAPMNWTVFSIWGIWDAILVVAVTGFVWLFLERFGYCTRHAVLAGTLFWAGVFVILWVGVYNMNLATPKVLCAALPLAWVEQIVAALIVNWGMRYFRPQAAA